MLADVLNFLRRHLDERLRLDRGGSQDDADGDRVVFAEGDKLEPLSLPVGAVSLLLINLEEERILRGAEPRIRHAGDGTPMRVHPDLRLALYVLFVGRFKRYDTAWDHLSAILEYLQANPVFEPASAPDLPRGVDRLILELVTLDFARQNEVWNALRIGSHPALLYRVRLVAFRDRHPTPVPVIADVTLAKRRLP
jgi:hypothetical protein